MHSVKRMLLNNNGASCCIYIHNNQNIAGDKELYSLITETRTYGIANNVDPCEKNQLKLNVYESSGPQCFCLDTQKLSNYRLVTCKIASICLHHPHC